MPALQVHAAPSPYEAAAGHASRSRRRAAALVGGVAGVPAAAVLVVLALILGPVLAVGPALVLWVVAAVALWRAAPGIVLRRLGAVPADPVLFARLHNLTESLCVAAGLPKPSLQVVEDGAPNSLCVGLSPRSTALVVTTGLADQLTRLELEGVLAHELCHIRRGDAVLSAAAAVTLGPALAVAPGPAGRLAARVLAGREAAADVAAIGLTRYPPALISALEKARDQPEPVAPRPRGIALLWNAPSADALAELVGPGAPDSVEVRIEALLEL